MLHIMQGQRRDTNHKAIRKALEKPSLIIDCANAGDPHQFSKEVSQEKLHQTYIIIAESIYRFRDTLREVSPFLDQHNINRICITSFDRLFNYQDEYENICIIKQSWQYIEELSKRYEIYVVKHGTYRE